MSPMSDKWQMVHLRIDRELYDKIERQAQEEERPVAVLIRRLLADRFGSSPRKGKSQ